MNEATIPNLAEISLPLGQRVVIPARSARAFIVRAGQIVRVIDAEGQQVADFHCVNLSDQSEALSGICTSQLNKRLFPTTGNVLFSTRRRAMFTIVADSVGRHDLLMGACSRVSYLRAYGVDDHPNCQNLLQEALRPWGYTGDASDTFNAFMNVPAAPDGTLSIEAPLSREGDYVDLRAEMDCLVAVSACPADISLCNARNPTSLAVQILEQTA